MKTNSSTQLLLAATFIASLASITYAKPPRLEDMDDKTKAAFTACIEEYNMPAPGSGERPSKELHEKFEKCLISKGVTPPKHHGGPKGPPPEDVSDRNASENTSIGTQ